MRQRADGIVLNGAGIVHDLLELNGGSAPLSQLQVSVTPNVSRPKSLPEFVWRSRHEGLDGLGSVATFESCRSTDHRQIFRLHDRIFGEALGQIIGQPRSLGRVTCQSKGDSGIAFNIPAI